MDTSNDTQQSIFSAISYANRDEVQKMLSCLGTNAIIFCDYVISVLVPKYKKDRNSTFHFGRHLI